MPNKDDIEIEIIDRKLTGMDAKDIENMFMLEALKGFAADSKRITNLLWDNKIDDREGQKMLEQHALDTYEYLMALNAWVNS